MNTDKEITFEFAPPRVHVEYELMRDGKDLKNDIEKGGQIAFEVGNATKTLLDTSVFCDMTSITANMSVEGINTTERKRSNYFSGGSIVSHHFKVSKAQGAEEFKTYLKGVIAHIERILNVEVKQTHFVIYTNVFA